MVRNLGQCLGDRQTLLRGHASSKHDEMAYECPQSLFEEIEMVTSLRQQDGTASFVGGRYDIVKDEVVASPVACQRAIDILNPAVA